MLARLLLLFIIVANGVLLSDGVLLGDGLVSPAPPSQTTDGGPGMDPWG